jgi:hypothetical protein
MTHYWGNNNEEPSNSKAWKTQKCKVFRARKPKDLKKIVPSD